MHRFALGFRDHTGWAAAILLERSEAMPRVLASRRFTLCPPDLPSEAYHAAASLDSDAGKALVAAVADTARDMAAAQVNALLEEFGASGGEVVAGVPVGTGRIPESIAAITRVHAMMHAAEGHLFREALADACIDERIEVHRYPNKQLGELATVMLGTASDGLATTLSAMGVGFGPPWTRDQKDAVTAAWLALVPSGE